MVRFTLRLKLIKGFPGLCIIRKYEKKTIRTYVRTFEINKE